MDIANLEPEELKSKVQNIAMLFKNNSCLYDLNFNWDANKGTIDIHIQAKSKEEQKHADSGV